MCDKDADIRTEPELHILYNFETSKDYKKFRQVGQSTGLCLQSSGVELNCSCGFVASCSRFFSAIFLSCKKNIQSLRS